MFNFFIKSNIHSNSGLCIFSIKSKFMFTPTISKNQRFFNIELTIIYNKEPNIITNLLVWLKCVDELINKERYIFLFEDGERCEYNDKITYFNFHFCCIPSMMPLYFEEGKHAVYLLKGSKLAVDHVCLMDYTRLFSSYTKYDNNLTIDSKYNYYKHRFPNVFGIIRIRITSTELIQHF